MFSFSEGFFYNKKTSFSVCISFCALKSVSAVDRWKTAVND